MDPLTRETKSLAPASEIGRPLRTPSTSPTDAAESMEARPGKGAVPKPDCYRQETIKPSPHESAFTLSTCSLLGEDRRDALAALSLRILGVAPWYEIATANGP